MAKHSLETFENIPWQIAYHPSVASASQLLTLLGCGHLERLNLINLERLNLITTPRQGYARAFRPECDAVGRVLVLLLRFIECFDKICVALLDHES